MEQGRGVWFRRAKQGLLLLVLLAACAFLTYLVATSSSELKLAIVAALSSVAGLAYTQRSNTRLQITSQHFSKEAEVYEEVFQTIMSLFGVEKGLAESIGREELVRKLFNLKTSMLVWAGFDVLSAWKAIEDIADDADQKERFVRFDALLVALRKELGHDDRQLGELGLIRILVRKADHHQFSSSN
jgi:hypothetical protein